MIAKVIGTVQNSLKSYSYRISLLASLVAIFIIIDILLSNISAASKSIATFIHSDVGILLFVLLCLVSAAGQILILRYIKGIAVKLWLAKLRLHKIHAIVMASQYILISLVLTTAVQIVILARYNIVLLAMVTTISYSLNCFILIILAVRLLRWYLLKHDTVILVLSLASFTSAFSAVTTISFSLMIFGSSPLYATSDSRILFPVLIPGTAIWTINYFNSIFSIVSFVATWLGAVLLLRHYAEKYGKYYYWIISAPLIYFLSQFANILYLYNLFINADPTGFFLSFQYIFSLNSTIGGILFGVVFWTAATKIERISALKNYLTIAGFGFFLFFASGSATVVQIPFPPYGLQMVSIVGISSYLMFFGLYSSAVVLSEDIVVRRAIRNTAAEQYRLLGNISYAEMENKITHHVVSVVGKISNKIMEESGVESSYSDSDIRAQVQQIVNEIIKDKNKFATDSS